MTMVDSNSSFGLDYLKGYALWVRLNLPGSEATTERSGFAMSSTPAPTPSDDKLAAPIASYEGAARADQQAAVSVAQEINSRAESRRSGGNCQAIRMVGERAKTFRAAIQHRRATVLSRVQRLREDPLERVTGQRKFGRRGAGRGDAAC
ncbi:hypothetical protein H8N00_13710 [Streptomyces sp. AC563]|uniref:hypothetical protein n=1 Tax=Streptomyces buecherae TaxID=2763006 RepID=UPI00164E2961|nr:hypothetical protein [Streptomyces buecherae]MBC3989914.1 hypothetical protein [Streptomyces buecherae]